MEAATTAHPDLSWPDAYENLLPLIRDRWKVEGEIYFRQQLGGGKSGALVYIADIACAGFSGQAILKLDDAPDPKDQEEAETERHRDALEAAPDYGAKHLAKIVHTLEHEGQIAILSTVVAGGLEYSGAWSDCSYQDALAVIERLSGGLLEDWNQDYRLAPGMHMPQELLESWLGERLDPQIGRIHKFLAERCQIQPEEPSLSFEGHWYPNPLAFARGAIELPSRLRLRAAEGHIHGDLHGFNVLVRSHGQEEPDYFLIDMAHYQDKQYLFFDHGYFELAYLLTRREFATSAQWDAMLDHLSLFHHMSHSLGLWQDDVGLMESVRALRRGAMSWVERHENQRLSFMESQYILARVAVGLNFANKRAVPDRVRRRAFLYAASNLKDYIKLNNVDWPKHGPVYRLDDASEAETAVERDAGALATPTAPPAEKDRLIDRMVAELPEPQKPIVAVMPFEYLGGNAETEHIVDGITQEVITELSKVDWLAVVSPSSTFAFKGKPVSAEEIAQRLGAHYMVEGSVRGSADLLRVTAHLVDTSTGHHLWADRLERKIEDVFALQQDIAEAVVGNIDWELKFDIREQARLKRGEVSVWDRVQKAMWHLFKFTNEDTAMAKDILAKTIDLTPDYAYAHAGMCLAELRKVLFGRTEDPTGAKQRALAHAERAVALDEKNSFAHIMLSRVCSAVGQHDRAIAEAETAIGLNRSAAGSHLVETAMVGTALMASGRPEEALPYIETAIRLSTTGSYLKIKILAKGFCLYMLDDLEAAEACVRPTIDAWAVGPFGKFVLAAGWRATGRLGVPCRGRPEPGG